MGTRKSTKKLMTAWLEPEENAALKKIAASLNIDFTDLLRKIAHGQIEVKYTKGKNGYKN